MGWMMVSFMYPTISTLGLALGASGSSKGDPTQPPPSGGQEEEEDQLALPPSPALPGVGSQSSAPLAHNSHAAGGPRGNRQSSDPYGSFKPPFLPNNPPSGAVLIPSRRQPLGMPGPSLGWINCCAVIFTQQLPALIPLLPAPAPATGPPPVDNTLKAGPAGQGARGLVSHGTLAGVETLGPRCGLEGRWEAGAQGFGCREESPDLEEAWDCAGGVAWRVATPRHLCTELPAPSLPSLLPELSQPWLLREFGAQTQLSLLH